MASSDENGLSRKDAARMRSRDKKRAKPKVVADNPGMRKLQIQIAEKLKQTPRSLRAGDPPSGGGGPRQKHRKNSSG